MKYVVILLLSLLGGSLSALCQTNAVSENVDQQNSAASLSSQRYKEIYGPWFYMPSFPIDLLSTTEKSINLYTEYSKQYSKVNPAYVIPSAMIKFHAIGYDNNIYEKNPSVDQNHVITYKVKSGLQKGSQSAYLTIIGVIQ